MKLFGFVPYYREKDIEAAKKLYCEAQASYDLAKKTTTVLEFIAFWNNMKAKNKDIHLYESKISPSDYTLFLSVESKESEFQWRLRDAIERSRDSAIADIMGDYRNNAGVRVEEFCDDLNYAADLADAETARFYLRSLYEVTDLAGIKIDKHPLDALESPKPVHCSDNIDEIAVYGGTDAILLSIDLMEGHAFESWCADALQTIGFSNVRVTPGSGDQGVDVLAQKDGIKYAIQCKCYSSPLGNTPIQEVAAGKSFYRCHVGVVMTNQYFTPKAKELAEATGTLLWDRDWIIKYLKDRGSDEATASPVYRKPYIAQDDYWGDKMLLVAVEVVLETGQASVSMLQRRLKLNYARAARIVDEMEEKGIVGPFVGSKPRQILITREQWEQIKSTHN